MVWYPSVDDVIDMNIAVLDLSGDRHQHKMLGSKERIQAVLDRVKTEEDKGLVSSSCIDEGVCGCSHFFAEEIIGRDMVWQRCF